MMDIFDLGIHLRQKRWTPESDGCPQGSSILGLIYRTQSLPLVFKPHRQGHPIFALDRRGGAGHPPAIELEGDQFGDLGRDVCHRIFCSTQATSRGEHGAEFAESFVRRLVHNGDELVTR